MVPPSHQPETTTHRRGPILLGLALLVIAVALVAYATGVGPRG
ncbi:hypothetical protein [Methylobacterium sp. JK268]